MALDLAGLRLCAGAFDGGRLHPFRKPRCVAHGVAGCGRDGHEALRFALLQTGDTTARPDSVLSDLFAGHMANIEGLAEEGKLVVAGPFYDIPRAPRSWRGVFVLNTSDTAEARGWVNQDPAVQAGVFDVVLAPWYSSGALQAVQGLHQDLQASE